ncbi:uncharacterized protein CTRU02_212160 [Colletotrichum truncatum]|uniref:Uncharacterized protein n=1 Tax=Colletotrichum truncatum TaxID=5467 RepID=A0ACC3YPR9_COLTU|nr:uncharacterized protein CTRU02_06770 [Colletotrichum truncatum]KAF6792153.1 hypothetical protein CTRU02_06770 [Colletotrichum truncatum]
MKGLSGILADAYATWLSPLTHCCAPLSNRLDEKQRQNTFGISEKLPPTVTDQPVPMPPPFAGTMQKPVGPRSQPEKSNGGVKRSFASLRKRFSVRKRIRSDSSSPRRLQISGPTNFRHLHSESFQFPQYTSLRTAGRPLPPRPLSRTRPSSFRPLELSIYVPKRELSPILPHFEMLTPPPPPPARVQPNPKDDVYGIVSGSSHEPSYSPMSFHLPRKMSVSPSTMTPDDTPPRIPPKSIARSLTSLSVEEMKHRIAGAMLEVDKLQREIDLVMERQSIYAGSRPSTAHSTAPTVHDMEPMPTVPALPPAAPSFAQRLNPGVERPHTAPPRPPVHIPHRGMAFADASAAFITPPPSRGREARPPPPPLPLVLRPPLRKKKSFSRVSSWLFPSSSNGSVDQHHHRNISHDSVTNYPRPVKGNEGFYQCVHVPQGGRSSFDSVSTVSTWESEDGGQTVPTTWSPGSTPATRAEEHPPLERVTTFGKEKDGTGPRRGSVGVAF